MHFASAVSTAEDPATAAREIATKIESVLDPSRVDLLFVFASRTSVATFRTLAGRLADTFPKAISFGCTGEGTIGDGHETERRRSVAVLAGSLPGVAIRPVRLPAGELGDAADVVTTLAGDPAQKPIFLVLGDPVSFDLRSFLDAMNAAYPGAPIVGGMASAGFRPGENALLLGGDVHDDGGVALVLTGNIQVETVVSQGCRPLGKHFVVTRAEGNVIKALRNLGAMDALREVLSQVSAEDRELIEQGGLFVGRAIDEYKSSYGRGDFLIQGLMGIDKASGGLAIAGEAKVGTTVQFHVRDRDSADEDLKSLLAPRRGVPPPDGALLFSCNGRGTRMWDEPGHDVGVLREAHAAVPVAGFFCAGEIGPVGGQNFVHGYTASVALFRPRD